MNHSVLVLPSLAARNKSGNLGHNPTHIFMDCEMGVPFDNTYDPVSEGDAQNEE